MEPLVTLVATPHRRLSADAAVELAMREADRIGLRLNLSHNGPARHPTAISRLVRDGEAVSVGYGKGRGAQGTASAHFEALERYYTTTADNRRFADGAAEILPAPQVAAQEALRPDLVIQRWAAEYPDSRAACTRYAGHADSVWYPLFLTDPRYHLRPLPGDAVDPYHGLVRYTSSLGAAAGGDLVEAVLHGLCELIEHDAVSHALLRWFVAGPREVDLVERHDVPDHVRTLWTYAEEAVDTTVHLVDVTTDLGVPAYLAIADGESVRPGTAGGGASPIAGYAAERALGEVIQATGFPTTAADPGDKLGRWPALRDCARLDAAALLTGHVRRVPLRPDLEAGPTVPDAVERLARLLRGHGLEWYSAELTPADSLVSVAAVIAPGLERFSLVRLGQPVVPTGRGWPLWAGARDAALSATRAERET
jgi:ribosomal protein S12 methylthiotransferase accessory factor